MENSIDVVYVLGTGSKWRNNEIRFSLRSIEKFGVNVGQVFVVGVCPNFLTGVIHIPAEDNFNPNVNADGNIALKVLAACADERLSDDFLFINDDHILLRPMRLNEIPPFHKGDMTTYPQEYWQFNYWRKRLHQTMRTLVQKGMTAFHFDCHVPIIFNKKIFPEVMLEFPFREGVGLTMKSLYGNSVYVDTAVILEEEKKTVFQHYTFEQLYQRLADCQFMSFNDQGLNNSLKYWLYREFPDPSRWETSEIEDKVIEIVEWFSNSRDYAKGVEIFEKYIRGENLLKIFKLGETPVSRKKLEFKLKHSIEIE